MAVQHVISLPGISKKFNVKVFYVMGKALSGELSCPCDRACFMSFSAVFQSYQDNGRVIKKDGVQWNLV